MNRWSKRDLELGMDRGITRRDFLNGVALSVGGVAATSIGLGAPAASAARTPELEIRSPAAATSGTFTVTA